MKKRKKNKDNEVKCPYCNVSMFNKGSMATHIRSVHKGVAGNGKDKDLSLLPPKESSKEIAPTISSIASNSNQKREESSIKVESMPEIKLEQASSADKETIFPKPIEEGKWQEVSQKSLFSGKELEGLLDVVFNRIAALRGEFWKLSKDEKEAILPPLTKITNKYLGNKVSKYSDEIVLATSLGFVLVGKFLQDKKENKNPFFRKSGDQEQNPPNNETPAPDFSDIGTPDTKDILEAYNFKGKS